MKINRNELRFLIENELKQSQNLNEGLFDAGIFDTVENYITILVGAVPGYGDGAVLTKAFTVDIARVAKDLSDLSKLLKPVGMDDTFNILLKTREEVIPIAKKIFLAPKHFREKLREEFYQLAESIKKFLISVMSANPEPFSSVLGSSLFTMTPAERFFIDAAPVLGEIFTKINSNKIGKVFMSILKIIVGVLTLGVFGAIFNDPFTFFENLGLIVDATLEDGKYTHLFVSLADSAGSLVKENNIVFENDRMKLLAGIKWKLKEKT